MFSISGTDPMYWTMRYCKLKGENREMFISAPDILPHSEKRDQIEEASAEMDESTVASRKLCDSLTLLCFYRNGGSFFFHWNVFCLITACAVFNYQSRFWEFDLRLHLLYCSSKKLHQRPFKIKEYWTNHYFLWPVSSRQCVCVCLNRGWNHKDKHVHWYKNGKSDSM